MKPFFVYMLRCADGRYYVGHTDDLEKRVAEHQAGTFAGWTSERRPVELVWFADTHSRELAIEWELKVKPWSRRKKEALIRGDLDELKRASRGPNRQDRSARRPSSSPVPSPTRARGAR